MSYYNDPWNSPESFGLELIGYVDWSSGQWEFDYSAVWYRAADNTWWYGEDAGCSCPSPFEDKGMGDLTPLVPPVATLEAMLKVRYTPHDPNDKWSNGDKAPVMAELLERVAARIWSIG